MELSKVYLKGHLRAVQTHPCWHQPARQAPQQEEGGGVFRRGEAGRRCGERAEPQRLRGRERGPRPPPRRKPPAAHRGGNGSREGRAERRGEGEERWRRARRAEGKRKARDAR